jgi:fimbrial chaperone protein
MRSLPIVAAFVAALLWLGEPSEAASLRVAPTTISLVAPDAASVLSLRNDDKRPINVQIRVFRWTQVDGVDRLEPARDVVASPPAARLAGGAATTVRIVRVSKAPVAGEESYRLLVDELPDPSRVRSGTVALVLRYSIPVFFVSPEAHAAQVKWSVRGKGGSLSLTATNPGDLHVRVSALSATAGKGRRVSLGEGLAGYVLGGSSKSWSLAGTALTGAGRRVTVTAMSEAGPIDAVASAR